MREPSYMIKAFINDPPATEESTVNTVIGSSVIGQLTFSDPDVTVPAQVLTASIVDTPTLGSFTSFDPATGAFTFQAGSVIGSETLNWEVSDGALTTGGTIEIVVGGKPTLQVEQPQSIVLSDGGAPNDFQVVHVGSGGLTKTFNLSNVGTEDLLLSGVSKTGVDAADFIVDTSGMLTTVGAGGGTIFTVRFDPASLGVKSAALEIASNDVATLVFDIPLTGTGVTPEGGYDIVVAQAGLVGPDAEEDAIPHHDGVKNLLKYAFHLDLTGPDVHTMAPGGDSGLPLLTVREDLGQRYWKMEFVRRKASGLVYELEKTAHFDVVPFAPVSLGAATVSEIDDFWERLELEVPFEPTTDPKEFMRVRVTLP